MLRFSQCSFLFSFLLFINSCQASQREQEDIELQTIDSIDARNQPSLIGMMNSLATAAAHDQELRLYLRREWQALEEATAVPPTKDQMLVGGKVHIPAEITRMFIRCFHFVSARKFAAIVFQPSSLSMILKEHLSFGAAAVTVPAIYLPVLFEKGWSKLVQRWVGPSLSKEGSERICRAIGQVALGVQCSLGTAIIRQGQVSYDDFVGGFVYGALTAVAELFGYQGRMASVTASVLSQTYASGSIHLRSCLASAVLGLFADTGASAVPTVNSFLAESENN